MPSTATLLATLLSFCSITVALRCLEGADCLRDASCLECEGVACMRIISFNLEDNREVALTCVPSDTRRYGLGYPLREPYLEAEGCENTGDRRICVCYGRDYCNHSSSRVFLLPVLLIVALL